MSRELLNPRGVFHYEKNVIAPRLLDLNEMVIGLVDNGKDNADVYLNCMMELLKEKYTIKDTLTVTKPTASLPAHFTQEFLDKCNFVINAFGD